MSCKVVLLLVKDAESYFSLILSCKNDKSLFLPSEPDQCWNLRNLSFREGCRQSYCDSVLTSPSRLPKIDRRCMDMSNTLSLRMTVFDGGPKQHIIPYLLK